MNSEVSRQEGPRQARIQGPRACQLRCRARAERRESLHSRWQHSGQNVGGRASCRGIVALVCCHERSLGRRPRSGWAMPAALHLPSPVHPTVKSGRLTNYRRIVPVRLRHPAGSRRLAPADRERSSADRKVILAAAVADMPAQVASLRAAFACQEAYLAPQAFRETRVRKLGLANSDSPGEGGNAAGGRKPGTGG